MSTTLDPNTEAHPRPAGGAALSNGKLDLPPSQAAARPGFWHKDAAKTLLKGNLSAEEAWEVYWSKRKSCRTVSELCDASETPVAWAIEGQSLRQATKRLIQIAGDLTAAKKADKFTKGKRRRELRASLSQWLESARHAAADVDLAVGSLAAAHIVAAVGEALDASLGWKLIDFLTDVARHAQPWSPKFESTPRAVVAQQILAGELPLTLAYQFSEMSPLRNLRGDARIRLSEGITELLNGRGLPRAAHLDCLRPLLACWTRCRAIGKTSNKLRWTKPSERQYKCLVRQAIRWTAASGEPLFASDDGEGMPVELIQTALRLSGDAKDTAAARKLLGKKSVGGKKLQFSQKMRRASDNCEWSRLSLMRTNLSPESATIAVDFSTPQMRLDVWANKRRLFAGAWSAESRINGESLKLAGNWEQSCWFKDKDVDYLEFALELKGGVKLERQILLAHRDRFLLLVDHLQNSDEATLEHAWQLPLGPGLLFCGEGETRDALLVDGAPRSRVMPVALPEWRIDPRVGELSFAGGTVRLAQRTAGRSIACPLFVDLCPDRSALPCTWRQLTVAESLQIKSSDVAVSYRMQSGDDQWLYYRSQGPRGNRTFMGQNTSSECVIARFKAPSGEVDQLLEIEG